MITRLLRYGLARETLPAYGGDVSVFVYAPHAMLDKCRSKMVCPPPTQAALSILCTIVCKQLTSNVFNNILSVPNRTQLASNNYRENSGIYANYKIIPSNYTLYMPSRGQARKIRQANHTKSGDSEKKFLDNDYNTIINKPLYTERVYKPAKEVKNV